eukprot:COSAG04_NODE_60_length_30221_cov_15.908837_3_plen_143_part_00
MRREKAPGGAGVVNTIVLDTPLCTLYKALMQAPPPRRVTSASDSRHSLHPAALDSPSAARAAHSKARAATTPTLQKHLQHQPWAAAQPLVCIAAPPPQTRCRKLTHQPPRQYGLAPCTASGSASRRIWRPLYSMLVCAVQLR